MHERPADAATAKRRGADCTASGGLRSARSLTPLIEAVAFDHLDLLQRGAVEIAINVVQDGAA